MLGQDFFNICFHIRVFVIGVDLNVQPVEMVVHKVIRTKVLSPGMRQISVTENCFVSKNWLSSGGREIGL